MPSSIDLSHAVADWLLSEAVARPQPVGRAVINYSSAGQWNAFYPEICGYYLQFASLAAETGEANRFRSAAADVAAWLDAVGGPLAEPQTLLHRDPIRADWRAACLFSFDLSVIVRGLTMAETRWPGITPTGSIDNYVRSVARITKDGRLDSHLLRSEIPIPTRWSTAMGVHHVKAAAALAGTGRPELVGLAHATIKDEDRLFAAAGASRMREMHPFLYFVEGWLTLWGQNRDPRMLVNACRAYDMVLGEIDPGTSYIPPLAHERGPVRSDVVAQALRAGLVLEAAGMLGVNKLWPARRDVLQAMLVERIASDGAVLFNAAGHRNSWASMFGWQALDFLSRAQRDALDPLEAAASLI